jgi:hypothetical protein
MSRSLLGWPAFLAIALAIQGAFVWSHVRDDPRERLTGRSVFEPGGYLYGDSGIYAAAAHSLVHDRDLDLLNQCQPGKQSLAEALPELEGELGGEFGLAAGGYLTIKQSPVFPAAAAPAYALFGLPGLLLVNLAVLTALLAVMAGLAGGTTAARAAVLAGFVLSPLPQFAFNFSPDLFLCLLVAGSVLAARAGRPTLAGGLAGLTVSTKLYVAALVLPVPLVVWFAAVDGQRVSALVRFGLGGVLGLGPGMAFNTWLFGAPWVTGYERQLLVTGGVVGLADHSSRFTVPPLVGLRELLFHPDLGLWPTMPAWFFWPLGLVVLLPRFAPAAGRAWVLAAVGVIGLNLAVFACYDGSLAGQVRANRYLFPAVVFGLAVLAAAVGRVLPARSWEQSTAGGGGPGLAGSAGESRRSETAGGGPGIPE